MPILAVIPDSFVQSGYFEGQVRFRTQTKNKRLGRYSGKRYTETLELLEDRKDSGSLEIVYPSGNLEDKRVFEGTILPQKFAFFKDSVMRTGKFEFCNILKAPEDVEWENNATRAHDDEPRSQEHRRETCRFCKNVLQR